MSSKLKTSVLAFAMMGVLGGGLAVAQTAPAPAAPETQTEQPGATPADVQVPDLLQGDAFSDVEGRTGRRGGAFFEGTIVESGKDFDAMVNAEGDVVGMRTAPGSALPQAVIDALLPEAARSNAILSEITELNAIGSRDGAVMIGGQDASGDDVRIAFDADGELVQFARGEHGKHGMGDHGKRGMGDRDGRGPGGDKGDKAQREAGPRGDGPRGDGAREGGRDGDGPRGDGDRAPREGAEREGGPRGNAPRDAGQPPAPPVDEAALRSAVEGAGYTELGDMTPGDRGIAIEAMNPQGEEVVVTVTPSGEVVRETAR